VLDRILVAFLMAVLFSLIRPFFFTIHRIRLLTPLAPPACFIVKKLGIWRGSQTCPTLLVSGFWGACRPLKFLILPQLSIPLLWFPVIKSILLTQIQPGTQLILPLDRTQWKQNNFCAGLRGQSIKASGQQKYIGRLKELKRLQRRHSNFWVGLYGQMWIAALESCSDWVKNLMMIRPNKRTFFQRGLRAMAVIQADF
jgi:hypothetical protein